MSFKLVEKYGKVFMVVKRKLTVSDVRAISDYSKRIPLEVVGSFDKDGFVVVRYKTKDSETGRGLVGDGAMKVLNDLVYAISNTRDADKFALYFQECVIDSQMVYSVPSGWTQYPTFNFNSCSIQQSNSGGGSYAMVQNWNIVKGALFLANGQTRFNGCIIKNVKIHSTDSKFKHDFVLMDTEVADCTITDLSIIPKGMLVSHCDIADCRLVSDVSKATMLVMEKKSTVSEYKACKFTNTDIFNHHDITYIFEDCTGDEETGLGLDMVKPQLTVFSGKSVPPLSLSKNIEDRYWINARDISDSITIGCRVDIDTPVTVISDSIILTAETVHKNLLINLDIGTAYSNIVDVKLKSDTIINGTNVKLNTLRPTVFSIDGTSKESPYYLTGGKNVVISGATNLYDAFLPLFNLIFGSIDDTKLSAVKKRLRATKIDEKEDPMQLIHNPPYEIKRLIAMMKLFNPKSSLTIN